MITTLEPQQPSSDGSGPSGLIPKTNRSFRISSKKKFLSDLCAIDTTEWANREAVSDATMIYLEPDLYESATD